MQIVHFIPILFIFFLVSCTRDKIKEIECFDIISYDEQVKTIIDTNCSYTGCHVQGFEYGDFRSYQAMLPYLNEASFASEVLSRDMPPSNAPGNKELDVQEIFMLQCWINGGYLEKN